MRMDCDGVHENVYAWALGGLPSDDARALEAHLDTCNECRAIADRASEMASSLGLAVPMRSASATLKSRVMASAAVLSDIGAPPARRSRMWQIAVAALVVIGVGATAWAAFTTVRMNDLESDNATLSADATVQSQQFGEAQAAQSQLSDTIDTQDAVIDVVLQPDAQRTELTGTAMAPGASGRCVWSRAQALGALVVSGLPATPDGSVYTMWIVYENEWLDAGDFTVGDDGRGRLVMRSWGSGNESDRDAWGAFEGFAVTVEPASGESAERGDMVMRSAAPAPD